MNDDCCMVREGSDLCLERAARTILVNVALLPTDFAEGKYTARIHVCNAHYDAIALGSWRALRTDLKKPT